jgi:hypothetical protein
LIGKAAEPGQKEKQEQDPARELIHTIHHLQAFSTLGKNRPPGRRWSICQSTFLAFIRVAGILRDLQFSKPHDNHGKANGKFFKGDMV